MLNKSNYSILFLLALTFSLTNAKFEEVYRFFGLNKKHNSQDRLYSINQHSSSPQIVCRNEITGQPLDWFTAYKLPRLEHFLEYQFEDDSQIIPFLDNGTAYASINNLNQSWKLSSLSINDTSSMQAKTLEPLYTTNFDDPNNKIGYILYNDQADKITVTKGHTKGVIIFDDKNVIWLVHSIPHYPPKPSTKAYAINPSQCVYGQSMICLSLNFDQLEKISQQLLYTFPQIYDYKIPQSLLKNNNKVLSSLMDVINGAHVNQAPWYNLNYFATVGGEKFLHAAKFTSFEDDLYAGLVSESLLSDLYTETWNHGPGTLPSNCTSNLPYHVYNIEKVKFNFGDSSVSFSVHHDHSKWAVTSFRNRNVLNSNNYDFIEPQVKIACIGDINRQEDQYKRAGGLFCFMNNLNTWQEYSNLVEDVETCKTIKVNWFKIKRIKAEKNLNEKIILL